MADLALRIAIAYRWVPEIGDRAVVDGLPAIVTAYDAADERVMIETIDEHGLHLRVTTHPSMLMRRYGYWWERSNPTASERRLWRDLFRRKETSEDDGE